MNKVKKSIAFIMSALFVVMCSSNMALATNNTGNQHNEISSEMMDDLQLTIKKETEKTLNGNGLNSISPQKTRNQTTAKTSIIDKNGNVSYLVNETDNTHNIDLLKQSYEKPVKIYSVTYENKAGSKSGNEVSKTTSDSYIYDANETVTYTFTIYADKKDGEEVDNKPTSRYKLKSSDFSWSCSGDTYSGVYSIDYNMQQHSCKKPCDGDSKKGDYGWPDHYVWGSTTINSGFTSYVNISDTPSAVGVCACTLIVNMGFEGGSVERDFETALGWGNVLP